MDRHQSGGTSTRLLGLKTRKDAGHTVIAEQPDAAAKLVTEFLA